MEDKRRQISDERGFSITEAIIVIVIIIILSSVALMQFGGTNSADAQFKRQNVARELKVALERARFDSVKRHAEGAGPASVVVNSGSYTLTTDLNQDGTFQSQESQVTTFSGQGITISGYNSISLPVTVTFNKRGEASTNGDVNPVFVVCNGTCPQTPSSSNANIVLVTPTGTVNLLAGGSTPPTFSAPNVSNIATSTGVSNIVSVP
jgi:type II secretory pathway pseudopilin PulG